MVEFENMEQARATFASPSYNEVRTIGNKRRLRSLVERAINRHMPNKYAKFRIVAVEGPSQ